jgi:hypothetical protein
MTNSEWSQFLFINIIILLATLFTCNINFAFGTDPFLQQKKDKVDEPLPGQNFNINFKHYSGYITVNEDVGRTLFYWFIEADHVDPMILLQNHLFYGLMVVLVVHLLLMVKLRKLVLFILIQMAKPFTLILILGIKVSFYVLKHLKNVCFVIYFF